MAEAPREASRALGRAVLEAMALGLAGAGLLFYDTSRFESGLHAPVARPLFTLHILLAVAALAIGAARLAGRPGAAAVRASLGSIGLLALVVGLPALALGTWALASPVPHEGVRLGLAIASLLPALAVAAWALAPPGLHESLRPATLALALAPSALLVAGAELGLHAYGSGPPRAMPSVTSPDRSYWTYRPGSVAEQNGVVHRFNSFGFRGPEPRPAAAHGGPLPVLVLGDSIPFGAGLPEERVFPWLAATLVNRAGRAARGVEVLNASLPGYATEQIRNLYARHLIGLRHELVVVVHYIDDVNRELHWKKDDRVYTPSWPEWMQDTWYGIRLWSRALELLDFGYQDFLLYRRRTIAEAWPRALALLDEIRAEAASRGARFAVFNVPRFKWKAVLADADDYRFIAYDRELAAWCRAREVPCHELLPALVGSEIDRYRMSPGDIHLNLQGHALAAAELARFLEALL